ncbi:MAG: S1 RNA-binding domain-containing protein [Candidatus Nomurabacteria bacterium]|nr:S1 RNA-binding domain-containing protein [Candidatus Nomurabacteria bacterium]
MQTTTQQLLDNVSERGINIDDIVEGTIISIEQTSVFVDLGENGTGIIFGREFIGARDMIKNINPGDTVKGKVIETENEDGYIELSLQEAKAALTWKEADEAMRDKLTIDLVVKEANKGGLMFEWNGIEAFLPVSQLKADKYPRVKDGDKDAILNELKKMIGETFQVQILSANPKENKLILTEQGGGEAEKRELITNYAVGDDLDGVISGATEFGVFVKIEEGLEGLVHISEMDWSLVEDPKKVYKIGDAVRVKVIEIKDGKISLSIKQTKDNPWTAAVGTYSTGQTVQGVVIKFNKHGALVSIQQGVAGLVHISEFGDDKTMRASIEIGKAYPFTINVFEPEQQKMTLSFAGDKKTG